MGAIDKKRIAKNTFFLYFRMLIVMGVTVYSARIVLDTLGVNDYGIYTLVGSVVILFTFLNSSMTTCTQRYLCVAIGKENPDYEKDVFTTSVISHILISILFLALSETAGLWLVLNVLNLPPGSKTVALIVYQFAIVTAVFTILRVPFNGAIIAYEKMDFYAYSSIIETALKLVILVPLTWMQTNKLILYSVLVAGVGLIILVWYQIYVFSHFKNCKVTFKEVKVQLMKEMLSFTGWDDSHQHHLHLAQHPEPGKHDARHEMDDVSYADILHGVLQQLCRRSELLLLRVAPHHHHTDLHLPPRSRRGEGACHHGGKRQESQKEEKERFHGTSRGSAAQAASHDTRAAEKRWQGRSQPPPIA